MNTRITARNHPHRAQPCTRTLCAGLLVTGFILVPPSLTLRAAEAKPPDVMSYQGYLVDANGDPLAPNNPANYPVIFRIYDQATGGNRLWSEQQIVTIDKGNFSLLLGEGTEVQGESRPNLSGIFGGTPLAVGSSERYLDITVTVNGQSLNILPRLRLLPGPYAYLARYANSLLDVNGQPLATAGVGNSLVVNGSITANSLSGNGAGLTDLNASNLSTGTVPDGRLSDNVARRDQHNTFAQNVQVNGTLRVGQIGNFSKVTAGYGSALVFSGGPDVSDSFNNDNSDPLWIARFNAADNRTELRVNIGDDPGGGALDKFVIGVTPGVGADFTLSPANWQEKFSVDSEGTVGLNGQLWMPYIKTGSGTTLVIATNGQVLKQSSSRRYKTNVSALLDKFHLILQAQPVQFSYISQPGQQDIGYIAEDLHELGLTNLVVYDNQGQPDAIRYDKICLYLNEIVKDQARELAVLRAARQQQSALLEAQQARLQELQSRLDSLEQKLRALSDMLPLPKPESDAAVAVTSHKD